MRVFISSVIGGLEEYRDAAAGAARALRHAVIRAEDFGARPGSPQQVCLAGVRDADVVVLLIGSRYGDIQPSSELSATHEEFREARERCDVLVFVQQGVDREPRQEAFLREVRDWASGHYTENFGRPEGLRDAVVGALHDLEFAKRTADGGDQELVARARALVLDDRRVGSPTLCLAVTGGPKQQIIRPADLEREELADRILQHALFGSVAVFSKNAGCDRSVFGDRLVLAQPHASILIDEMGSVRIVRPAYPPNRENQMALPVLIEEDIQAELERAVRFASWVWKPSTNPRGCRALRRLRHSSTRATRAGRRVLNSRRIRTPCR